MKWKIFELHTYDKNSLLPVKFNATKWLFIFLLILLSVFLLSAAIFKQEQKIAYIETETDVNLTHNETFSKDSLVAFIKSVPLSYKDVVMGQCIYESGHFTSPIWKENRNCLGMRHPVGRKTLSLGSQNGYGIYSSWKSCILDRTIYDALYMDGLSRTQYMAYLDKVYARSGGKSYSEELEKIIKDQKLKQLFK